MLHSLPWRTLCSEAVDQECNRVLLSITLSSVIRLRRLGLSHLFSLVLRA
jgi:hypothetical protein